MTGKERTAFGMTEVEPFGMTGGRGRCVQNDRGKRGLRSGWRSGGLVILSEGRDLMSVDGGCAMSLDSSLRCAVFGMTGGRGRCVRNDRGGRCSE